MYEMGVVGTFTGPHRKKTQQQITGIFHISKAQVSMIVTRKSWKHI